MNNDYKVIRYKNLKQFKEDHRIFFENKPRGEKYNVYKGYLITSANYLYIGYSVKVWQENEVGALIPVGNYSSLNDAKVAIDESIGDSCN